MRNPMLDGGLLYPESPSQTAGPYVHIGLALDVAGLPVRDEEVWNHMASPRAEGEHIEIEGRVIDGNGSLVRDVFIEAWQADHSGQYQCRYDLHASFNSFGRTAPSTEDDGVWTLHTVKPGRVAAPNGELMAPHISLAVFARGINIQLQTRLYFEDESDSNAGCPVFNVIESAERRRTLIARRREDGETVRYYFDIRLRGEHETVFFDF